MGKADSAQVRPRARRTIERISGTVAWLTLAAAVCAQDAQVTLSIPEQPLSSALLQLGNQAHISIAFSHTLVAEKNGDPVTGEMDLKTALTRLLRDSGLGFEFVRPDLVRIIAAPPAPQPVRTVRSTAV